MLAKVVATLDVLSDGRFELRLGAGAVPGYGIERPSAAMRVGMLDEGLQAMKLLWKEGKATFTGRFYQIHDATCDPLPAQKPHPPITIAAKGIKLLKVTASHANVWEGYFPPSEYMSRSKMIDNECCFIQRNSSDLERSLMLRVFIGKDEEEARERMERYIAERGISRERIERSKERDAVGDAEKCKQKIREYIQLGVTRFTLLVGDAGKLDPLKLLYEKVISKL
jgi:alkanesulfonate monooxygenase SsuD/methylene tetrahydromethanopterin reductase-like flavin-dependent oxidoreductase (luciferase family)